MLAEIVIDPEVPAAARRELEQTPLSALPGFGDPPRGPGGGGSGSPDDARLAALPGKQLIAGGLLAVVAVLVWAGLADLGPFAGDLVFLVVLLSLTGILIGGLSLVCTGVDGPGKGAAVTYHRRYVVPEKDLHDVALARWRRARAAAEAIMTSEAVDGGLVDSVEINAVLPYHLWDIAERLALMAAPERQLPAILRGVNTNDPGIQAVLGPQRRVHDLAVADVEGRIGRLEAFAALAGQADAARRRQRAVGELARLNPDYEELLVRLGEPDSPLSVTGQAADDLRAVAAEADAAVRRVNEAGRSLVIPAGSAEPGS